MSGYHELTSPMSSITTTINKNKQQKTYQLEEMVEQQRLDIEFYKAQLLGLGLSEGEDEKAVSMPAAGDPPGVSNTRALKLKVAKLQQTMRVSGGGY